MQIRRGIDWSEEVSDDVIQSNAKILLEETIEDDEIHATNWRIWRQWKRRNHAKRDGAIVAKFQSRVSSKEDVLNTVARQCLLISGTSAGRIWVGGKEEWEKNKVELLDSITKGL